MKYFKVSEKELRTFIEYRAKLEALEAGGVDNWEWYSDSIDDYLNDYHSDKEPDWFFENWYDEKMNLLIDKEIFCFKEVEEDA